MAEISIRTALHWFGDLLRSWWVADNEYRLLNALYADPGGSGGDAVRRF